MYNLILHVVKKIDDTQFSNLSEEDIDNILPNECEKKNLFKCFYKSYKMYANSWKMNDDKIIDNENCSSNDSNITFKNLNNSETDKVFKNSVSVACNDKEIGVGNLSPNNKEETALIDLTLASNSENSEKVVNFDNYYQFYSQSNYHAFISVFNHFSFIINYNYHF